MLIVDDDPMVRSMLTTILDSAGDVTVVAEAEDGDQVVDRVHRHALDVVLMDIRMRRTGGLAATREVLGLPDPPKVLVLTTFDLDEYVYSALRAGASGFLLKEESPQDIINAVRVVAAGEAMLSPPLTTRLITSYVTTGASPRRERARDKLADLSERERQVITEVARGKSNAEIGAELLLSEATVKTHLTRSFTKLDVTSRVQATIFAYEAGLVTP
ncbi:response regulator transcription factor [Haloechinothrix sp. LS1_15]|uniref:response regulator transcription factor n=1 Tax=Haloechinothrix sp. LS1_15 TaxID=2652248 RepID=UPI002946C14C|nr:response regulator transcription factor [Haloechinothrix sp. LS1_15]MDV6012331.1 response regulator transcription factor [Haloechinothrix sp. LS1_15]